MPKKFLINEYRDLVTWTSLKWLRSVTSPLLVGYYGTRDEHEMVLISNMEAIARHLPHKFWTSYYLLVITVVNAFVLIKWSFRSSQICYVDY